MAKTIEATIYATIMAGPDIHKTYFLEYFPETTHRKIQNLEKKLFAKASSEGKKISIEGTFLQYAKPEFEKLSKISG